MLIDNSLRRRKKKEERRKNNEDFELSLMLQQMNDPSLLFFMKIEPEEDLLLVHLNGLLCLSMFCFCLFCLMNNDSSSEKKA